MRLANAIEQCPTHDAHEGFRPERLTALDLQLDLSCVISLVACLAQRDQVVWRISARFTTLKGSSSKPSVAKPNETKMFRSVFPNSLKNAVFFALEIV